jgi:L-rhamnose mutarotase
MKVVVLFGLRRSGNHFVINRILQQFNNHVHLNNVNQFSYDNYIKFKEIPIKKKTSNGNWIGFKNCDLVCISCENMLIDTNELQKFKTNIADLNVFLLIRCPFDHFSSVWEVYKKNMKSIEDIMMLWKEYADIFLDKSNDYLFCKIVYDKFSTDLTYMHKCLQNIADKLVFNDNITIHYQNSSYNDKAKQRKVFSSVNTCNFSHDSQFTKLFDDEFCTKWSAILEVIG